MPPGVYLRVKPPKRLTVEERFWPKVKKGFYCWEWLGAKDPDGYGLFSTYDGSGEQRAHRVSYKLTIGLISKGLFVCHHCDNPGCVRPDHLFLGTAFDNNHDTLGKGRQSRQKLTTEQVRYIRSSTESCDCLAKKFGVHSSSISTARRSLTFKWVS